MAPQVCLNPFRISPRLKRGLILALFNDMTVAHPISAYTMHSSQMRYLGLKSCHPVRLKALSFHIDPHTWLPQLPEDPEFNLLVRSRGRSTRNCARTNSTLLIPGPTELHSQGYIHNFREDRSMDHSTATTNSGVSKLEAWLWRRAPPLSSTLESWPSQWTGRTDRRLPMNRWSLRDDEPVGSWRLWEKTTHGFRGVCGICLTLLQEKPDDRSMQPVGLGRTRILTDYIAPNLPGHWTQPAS